MGQLKKYAEQMAEAKGMTFEEFMSEEEEDFDLPMDWEPDFGGGDIRESQSYWKTLK